MITLTNVTKAYKNNQVPVLNGIQLSIQSTDRVAITGPSGSGKSTLLRLIAGIEPPTDGTVRLFDRNLYECNDDERAVIRRETFGFIFQSFRLFPSLTVLDNVALGLDIKGDTESREKAANWLNDVGLSHRKTHYPAELSGGEKQRVAIARALASHPKVIVADEPTGNLDQANSDMVKDLLTECMEKTKAALILVTHDLELATMCPVNYQLDRGQLVQ
ncbi:MAG: ABC transporter ATP-binding protein [Candidatus Marinamargulisbacteria bacterium]